MKKVIIVGSNHAGIAAANKLLDNKDIALSIYERGSTLSYLGCMSSLCLSQKMATGNELFYSDESELRGRGANVFMGTEIYSIDFEQKIIHAQAQDGTLTQEAYDTLILATGSLPKTLESTQQHTVHTIKYFEDTQRIDDALDHHSLKEVVVIGAGLIGLETAVSASDRHKHVRIIEKEQQILADYFDTWISNDILTLFEKAGITIELGKEVQTPYFEESNSPYPHQLHISTIGVTPNTTLGASSLKLSDEGAYLVDKHSQTSLKDVYAVGDCASVYSNALQQDIYSPQASHAIHSGTIAGRHINGEDAYLPGTQSSIGSQLLGLNLFATGANEKIAQQAGFITQSAHYKGTINHNFIDRDSYYKCTVVFEKSSRRILGAQLASLNDISMLTHMYSLAIAKQCTVDEIKHLDVFYHPQFNKLDNSFNLK